MAWYQTAFASHYQTLYAHRDAAEARRFVTTLMKKLPRDAWPMLDLGCGDGRHLLPLRAAGGTVLGLDLSPQLLAAAQRRGCCGGLIRGDMRSLPLADASLSTVLSLFTTFGYFGDLPAHLPMMRGVARVLRPGGIWVLDYLNCEELRRQIGCVTSRRSAGPFQIEETRHFHKGAATVTKDVSLVPLPGRESEALALGVGRSGLHYTESVAIFSLAALNRHAESAGLRCFETLGDYDGSALDEAESPRWILCFRKEGE